jgi:acetyl-CoA carboxylase biotin carboxyl carrier protein
MSAAGQTPSDPDRELVEALWRLRDLVAGLEGATLERFSVAAGEYRIEVERAAPAPPGGPIATGAGPGPGVDPGARSASGVFAAIDPAQADNRIPVLAPLVGTFYAASQPGAKPFVEVGDTVDAGQTVCIVEAMKLMNEVATGEAGRVAEVLVENGEWVEFEQVLMYLDPLED